MAQEKLGIRYSAPIYDLIVISLSFTPKWATLLPSNIHDSGLNLLNTYRRSTSSGAMLVRTKPSLSSARWLLSARSDSSARAGALDQRGARASFGRGCSVVLSSYFLLNVDRDGIHFGSLPLIQQSRSTYTNNSGHRKTTRYILQDHSTPSCAASSSATP